MTRFSRLLIVLLAGVMTSTAPAAGKGTALETVGIPAGFSELEHEHEVVADLYYGGRSIGEARVMVRPGFIRFVHPDQIVPLIPNVAASADLERALAGELPANADRVCFHGRPAGCGQLNPETVAVIYDEDHFRLDLFITRDWLQVVSAHSDRYLGVPTAPLSLTSSMGLALSGSNDSSPVYNFQNRTILGFRNTRIRADSSYASGQGLVMDTLVGEVDRPGLRYSAGLFWAPGLDLTGRRRILGVGTATQVDTRTDRESLEGTPLVLFLPQPARVDILIDGRLVTSGNYEAGNDLIDTSALPDGSYSVVLRIQSANGAIREERRFFVKNPNIAAAGQPIYFAYAGLLANTEPGRPVSLSNDIFYQVGTARRLGNKVAVDLSVIGTRARPIVEAGGWLLTRVARLRLAALASASGDHGELLEFDSGDTGRLSFSFDLRRVSSKSGTPLLPLPGYVDSFDSAPLTGAETASGSFTQASGSIGYRFGNAYLAVIASLDKERGTPVDYSVGPSLSWPILNRRGLQVGLEADAQLTSSSTQGFIGLKMFYSSGRLAVSGSAGARAEGDSAGALPSGGRAVGNAAVSYDVDQGNGTDLSVAAGVERDLVSTTAQVGGIVDSRYGTARGDISHDFEGQHTTQYALTLQTGAVLDRTDAVVGGRDLEESALVVSVSGDTPDAQFDVLVDDQPRGRVRTGGHLAIFLPPYHAYQVRLRPVTGSSVWYDSAARNVTLYPGNVQRLAWRAEHLLTVFGRALRPDGSPVANAMIQSRRGIGESDAAGYFQIEVSSNDSLAFSAGGAGTCHVAIAALKEKRDYQPLGRVICQ